MKLYGTPRSPYARKVRIILAEKNLPCELVVTRGSTPDSPVPALNPLGKVPTLLRDDGRALYDSPVIAEYLDGIGSGPKLIPEDFESRIEVRRWEALGDGVTEAIVAVNHERLEPVEKQHNAEWFAKRQAKITLGLALMERDLGSKDWCFGDRFTLADIAFAAASNSRPGTAVSVSTSMSFFQATKVGDVLTAAATELSLNRKLGTYRVEITNATGLLVASFLGTVYRREGP
jgi:glutathione S-transferase